MDSFSSNGKPYGKSSSSSADAEKAVAGVVEAVGTDHAITNGMIAALECWILKSSTPGEALDNMATGMHDELVAAVPTRGVGF